MISTTTLRRAAFRGLLGASAGLALVLPAQAQEWPAPNTAPPSVMNEAPPPFPHWEGPVPTDWVDEETGHRVIRISGDEGGSKLYFYRNSFTPEGDLLVYSSPLGLMRYDLDEGRRSVLIDNPDADLMFTARTSRTVFYSISDPGEVSIYDRPRTIYAADIDTGESRQVARIERGQIGSINADDTLLLGTVADGAEPLQPDVPDPRNRRFGQAEYSAVGPDGRPLNFARAKGVRMLQRWAARVPMEMFVIDLETGERRVIHEARDWLNHPQFSPTDPDRLIFSHEGPWHRVDRMWTMRVDGSDLRRLHERTMDFEIFGHEWFSPDGRYVHYDLQTPRGQVFWVASVDLETGERTYRRVEQNDWSVHFNTSPDGTIFAGDGGDADMVAHAQDGKWIVLLRPEHVVDGDVEVYDEDQITPMYLRGERLVNMQNHDYRLEPNITFTPDGRWIVFGSNMHGANHVYAVEVASAED